GAKSHAPPERRRINELITSELNRRLGLSLTDAFCGLKAYRVPALAKLTITDSGYAMPLELWVQAVRHGLRSGEVPVPLVYLEEKRSFGGSLDDGQRRLGYYHEVLDRAMAAAAADTSKTATAIAGASAKNMRKRVAEKESAGCKGGFCPSTR